MQILNLKHQLWLHKFKAEVKCCHKGKLFKKKTGCMSSLLVQISPKMSLKVKF